jgi:hypothetical protein
LNRVLQAALAQADVAYFIDLHFPKARRGNRVICQWRDGKSLSGSLYVSEHRCRLKDHVTGEVFDAFDFLTGVVGLSREVATREILKQTNLSPQHCSVPQIPIPTGVVKTIRCGTAWNKPLLLAYLDWLKKSASAINPPEPEQDLAKWTAQQLLLLAKKA